MTSDDSPDTRAERIKRIQSIVEKDYNRIQATDNPYEVLNLSDDATPEQIQDRYERYERFYRAENFKRLGNMDLTRKALDVRRSIGRAVVGIRSGKQQTGSRTQRPTPVAGDGSPLPSQISPTANQPKVDADAAALGDIYFRDGLSYLSIGDLDNACQYFQTACEYDPSRGIILAHLAYTRFKRTPTHEETVNEAKRQLQRAAKMSPRNAEVLALVARFAINNRDLGRAREAIDRMDRVDPGHPLIGRLKKRAKYDQGAVSARGSSSPLEASDDPS